MSDVKTESERLYRKKVILAPMVRAVRVDSLSLSLSLYFSTLIYIFCNITIETEVMRFRKSLYLFFSHTSITDFHTIYSLRFLFVSSA